MAYCRLVFGSYNPKREILTEKRATRCRNALFRAKNAWFLQILTFSECSRTCNSPKDDFREKVRRVDFVQNFALFQNIKEVLVHPVGTGSYISEQQLFHIYFAGCKWHGWGGSRTSQLEVYWTLHLAASITYPWTPHSYKVGTKGARSRENTHVLY